MKKLDRDTAFGGRFSVLLDRLMRAAGPRENLYSWTRRLESENERGFYERVKRWKGGMVPAPRDLLSFLGAAQRRYGEAIRRLAREIETTEGAHPERVLAVQLAALARGLKPTHVRAEATALKSVLAPLVAKGDFSPAWFAQIRAESVKVPKRDRRHRVRHLSRTEHAHLVRTAAEVEPRMVAPISVAPWLGPRVGELARLRAEDRSAGLMWIENMPEFGEAGACKTGSRPVPICSELAAILDRLPRRGWLFPSNQPGPMGYLGRPSRLPFLSRRTLEKGLARVRAAAGIPDVTWFVLRHTRAAWWLQGSPATGGGASIYKVADWLGHTVATCELFYGSLLDAYDPECERAPAA